MILITAISQLYKEYEVLSCNIHSQKTRINTKTMERECEEAKIGISKDRRSD